MGDEDGGGKEHREGKSILGHGGQSRFTHGIILFVLSLRRVLLIPFEGIAIRLTSVGLFVCYELDHFLPSSFNRFVIK